MNRTFAIGSLAVTAAAAFALGGLLQPSAQADVDTITMILTQEAPTLVPIDLHDKGASAGDMLAFEAKVDGEAGMSGTLTGLVITADVPDAAGDTHQDRLGQMTFDFGNGNSLVIAGETIIPGDSVEMDAGAPQFRAVVGGTGIHMGARGQIETVRQEDGTYLHEVTLIED